MTTTKTIFTFFILTCALTGHLAAEDCTTPPGTFVEGDQVLGLASVANTTLGDLDADGDLDVLVNGSEVRVLFNDGSGVLSDSGQVLGPTGASASALGDLDGDGDLDAWVGGQPIEDHVYFNNGSGVFTDSGQLLGPTTRTGDVALGDLDGDGDLDAFVANQLVIDADGNRVFINDGNGFFTMTSQSLSDSTSYTVDLADFDSDGDLDAFVANVIGQNRIWLNDGNATFDWGQGMGFSDSLDMSLGDLDGDGDTDALVADTANNESWTNDGNANFTLTWQDGGLATRFGNALGDLDGDGDLDVFVVTGANFIVGSQVWLGNGDGTFINTGQSLGNAGSFRVDLGDLDGDCDLDALVSSFTSASIWFNETCIDCIDADCDGFGDPGTSGTCPVDNCPNVSNPDQSDSDGDGVGDACEVLIDIEKFTNNQDADVAPGPFLKPGTRVKWRYVVTNTGANPLDEVAVSDSEGEAVFCPKNTLDVGESMTCSARNVVQRGPYRNVGRACGSFDGSSVCDEDASHYTGVDCAVSVRKTCQIVRGNGLLSVTTNECRAIGSTADVLYGYKIVNRGHSAVQNVTAVDDKLGPLAGTPLATLEPGQGKSFIETTTLDVTTKNVISVDYTEFGYACPTVEASATVDLIDLIGP